VVTLEYRNEDRLLLFTDGLFEQFNPAGDELGENRLKEMLVSALPDGLAGRTPQEIIDTVLRRSGEFRAGEERQDDLTLLCLDLRRSLAGLLKLG
jgi:Amt family ammonium transporter